MLDPRYKALLMSMLPFFFWIAVIASVMLFWNYPLTLMIVVIAGLIIGLKWSMANLNKVHNIYAEYFRREIAGLDSDDWLAIDLEILGTEDKLHVVPDDCGIIFKKENKIFIETMRGRSYSMLPAECVFIFTSKTSLACTISIVNATTGEPVFDYSVTPHYRGDQTEIPAHSGRKARWFAEWFGCELKNASNMDI